MTLGVVLDATGRVRIAVADPCAKTTGPVTG